MSVTRKQALAAVKKHGSKSAAARALGVTRNVLRHALEAAAAGRPTAADKQLDRMRKMLDAERASKVARLPRRKRARTSSGSFVRVIIPDSHGAHVHWPAAHAMLADIQRLDPAEIVWLGDHVDCGGTFSAHQRNYTNELAESYEQDCAEANALLDLAMQAAPNARHYYLEGNHEAHVERWAARNFPSFADAKLVVDRLGPYGMLRLRERGIEYFKRSEMYEGLPIPGTIRLGKCFFTHGIVHNKYATSSHVERFGANIVHGHTHRAMSTVVRTVSSGAIGAWCPGTLAKLQPLYKHTAPTDWSHGYMLQFVSKSTGKFSSFCVPIFDDHTLLMATVDAVQR